LASPRTALILGGLFFALAVAFLPLVALAHQGSLIASATPLLIEVPYAAVGLIIARRQPRNPVGWLLLASGGLPLLGSDGGEYAWIVYGLGHHNLPFGEAAVFLTIGGFFLFGLLPLALLLFPDGRSPAGRWRWVAGVNAATVAAWAASTIAVTAIDMAEHGIHQVSEPGGGSVERVVNTPTGWYAIVIDVVAPAIAACWLLAAARLIVNWRTSSGALRQQLKCVVVGIALCFVAGAIAASGTAGGGSTLAAEVWSQVPWIMFSALPVGIGVGILKYRLYEIDRLVSRTLAYAILTATLAGVFLGIIGLATDILPFSSPVAVAASTLAVAALFNPLRRRVQHRVDRRFNRARYDAEATVATFSGRLRNATELDSVRHELLRAVAGAVEPAHASVWIRPPSSR
jgi:hypothetical protein